MPKPSSSKSLQDLLDEAKIPTPNPIAFPPQVLSALSSNPILRFLAFMATPTSLNTGEDEWLKKNKKTGPVNEELLDQLFNLSGK